MGALEAAELYWLTTVRADGRPHVTPLVGVIVDATAHFCTGLDEQKARNLDASAGVALTTGTNTWDRGLDVVVERTAVRVDDGVLAGDDGGVAAVFQTQPSKVLAFAKQPHGKTSFRFA